MRKLGLFALLVAFMVSASLPANAAHHFGKNTASLQQVAKKHKKKKKHHKKHRRKHHKNKHVKNTIA